MHSRRLQERLDAAIEEGWQIERETPDRVVLVRRSYGSVGIHILLAVFTAWWSFAVFNLLYAGYSYLEESERRVLREPSEEICPECGAASRPGARGSAVGHGVSPRGKNGRGQANSSFTALTWPAWAWRASAARTSARNSALWRRA